LAPITANQLTPRVTPLPEGAEKFKTSDVPEGKTTAEVYAPGTPEYWEREALHRKIRQEFLDKAKPVPEGQQPVAIVTGGGTASGKSSFVRMRNLDENAVNIDTDRVKTRLPEYREWKETDSANASKRVHKEASGISKDMLNEAIEQRKNIVIDSTTSGADDLNKIQNLKDKGYKVILHFMDIPTDLAIERERFRAENSPYEENRGRKTPRENIEATHKGAAEAFFKLKDIANEAHVWDNSRLNEEPKPIYERVGNSPKKVYNEVRYNEYTNKANGRETRLADSDSPRVRAIQSLLEEEVRLRAETARNSGIRPGLDASSPELRGNGSESGPAESGNGLARPTN
jgi:predicted ABC-type ATPase